MDSLVISDSGAFALIVTGTAFPEGAVVQWNGADLETTFMSGAKLAAAVPASSVPATSDISTALITVKNPCGAVSSPVVFLVVAGNVAEVDSSVAQSGQSVSVSTAPSAQDPNNPQNTDNTAGISATLVNAGDPSPVTVSTAIYSSIPSPSTAFEIDTATGVAGEFMDLQVTGADVADSASAWFYYPDGTDESGDSPVLKYYDGSDWVPVFSSEGAIPEKDTTSNLDGTLSGGRLSVRFDNPSTPAITELGGTFFAITFTRPPLTFNGYLAPIGGADASGGSFANPLKTFKAGSTIPVKFKIARGSTAVVTGVHQLQAVKYSDETTAAAPIDATSQKAATTGNQFVLTGQDWHFNLDTKATGLTKGIWQLVATLSDGSAHYVWLQIK